MNRRRVEYCPFAPRSRASTVISGGIPCPRVSPLIGRSSLPWGLDSSATAGVHFQVGISLQLTDLDEGAALGDGEALLRAAVDTGSPPHHDQTQELVPVGA